MTTAHPHPRLRPWQAWVLAGAELFVVYQAVSGGIGLINNTWQLPTDWLTRTPFDSWVGPGRLLIGLVGLPHICAAVPVLARPRRSRLGVLAGVIALRALERRVDQILPGVPWCEAWPALRAHLLLIGADGHDPITELATAAAGTELGTATDPAAVLDWRLDPTGTRSHNAGPLPWIPSIPSTLAAQPEWGPYLTARGQLVADLADTVHQNALISDSRPGWVTTGVGQPDGQTIADITVWRAAMNVPDTDLRPTGNYRTQPPAGNTTSNTAWPATGIPP